MRSIKGGPRTRKATRYVRPGKRRAIVLTLLAANCLAPFCCGQLAEVFDYSLYENLRTGALQSADDVIADYEFEIFQLPPIAQPDPEFILEQPVGLRAFDECKFPQWFLEGLIPAQRVPVRG